MDGMTNYDNMLRANQNLCEEKKILAIDMIHRMLKHTCFSSGVKKLPGKPPLATRVIETTDGFYAIGNGKVSVQKSKTEDESMRVLTMAAIAEELKKNGSPVQK